MESLGQSLRAEGIAVFAKLLAVVEQRQALFQGEQGASAARLDLADHVGHLQAFFVLLVLHQGQAVGVQGVLGGLGLELAVEEVGEVLCDALVVAALDLRAQFAHVAHGVEEQALHLVVLGFFRAVEQRVINLGEQPREVLGEIVHHQLAAVLHQFAEARLDGAAGKTGAVGWWSVL